MIKNIIRILYFKYHKNREKIIITFNFQLNLLVDSNNVL